MPTRSAARDQVPNAAREGRLMDAELSMAPMIVIGCGGSGGKVIAALRRTLEVQLRARGWTEGMPNAWQLIYVDTPRTADVDPSYGSAPPNYVSVATGESIYRNLDEAAVASRAREGLLDRFVGWRPVPSRVTGPVDHGAGQW